METSTTAGTGVFTVAGAVTGFRTFAASDHIVGELISYGIEAVDANGNPSGEWEIGIGQLTASTTITRLLPLESSAAGAAVNFLAGTKRVWSNLSAFFAQDEFSVSQTSTWNPPGSSTGVPGVYGLATISSVGTATSRALSSANRFGRSQRLGYVSTATAASIAGVRGASLTRTIGTGTAGGFVARMRFGTSDAAAVTGARMFVGMEATNGVPTNADPATILNKFGVAQLATGTNLQLVQAGSAAQASVDLGVNFPAAGLSTDLYDLLLISAGSVANTVLYNLQRVGTAFVASGAFPNATPGTTMPLNTQLLVAFSAWRNNNATALAVGIDVGSFGNYSDI